MEKTIFATSGIAPMAKVDCYIIVITSLAIAFIAVVTSIDTIVILKTIPAEFLIALDTSTFVAIITDSFTTTRTLSHLHTAYAIVSLACVTYVQHFLSFSIITKVAVMFQTTMTSV